MSRDRDDLIHDTDTCETENCPACREIHRDLEADRNLEKNRGN